MLERKLALPAVCMNFCGAVEGEKAANELAAATSTRFVENGAVSYCVPTAHFHFQSADALSLATEYNSDDGSILLTTLDRCGVAKSTHPCLAFADYNDLEHIMPPRESSWLGQLPMAPCRTGSIAMRVLFTWPLRPLQQC